MGKNLPILQVYTEPLGGTVTLSAGGRSASINGINFTTHESIFAALDHEELPQVPIALSFVENNPEGVLDNIVLRELSMRVMKDLLKESVENRQGKEVINVTKFSIQFGVRARSHPEVKILEEVDQIRVITWLATYLSFLRDGCHYEEHFPDGSVKMDYVE